MKVHIDVASVCMHGCFAILNVVKDNGNQYYLELILDIYSHKEGNKAILKGADVIEMVVKIMDTHTSNARICSFCSEILFNLIEGIYNK